MAAEGNKAGTISISEYDETPKNPILAECQKLMKSDLRRLLKEVYRLSGIITNAMMEDNYIDRLLNSDSAIKLAVVERALSAWSKLTTLRMRVDAPLLQADHLDIWELLDDLRDYARSTHEAFFRVVFDDPYNVPLVEEMDERTIYNSTDFFGIFEELLSEDINGLEELLTEIIVPVDKPVAQKKPAGSVSKLSRKSIRQ